MRTVPIREGAKSPAPPPASDASRVHTARVRPAAEGPGPPPAQSAAPGARSRAFAEGERAGAAAIEPRQSPGLLPDMRVASAPPPAAPVVVKIGN